MDAGNDKKTVEPIEASIVQTQVLPQAVMATPKQLRTQMERDKQIREIINDYIKNNMVAGKDYGTITIKTKSGQEVQSKPSLLKPGSEKFCGLFKIRATFRRDEETVEMLGSTAGILAYLCELVDGQGRVVGEGRGTAKADPNGLDFDINKQVKIAQKRAQIDAVLRTGGLSDFFTQDMEDAPKDYQNQSSAPSSDSGQPYPATAKQTDLISKLAKERFESPTDFSEFAIDLVGVDDNYTVKQASQLIGDLFKLPKLESDEGGEY